MIENTSRGLNENPEDEPKVNSKAVKVLTPEEKAERVIKNKEDVSKIEAQTKDATKKAKENSIVAGIELSASIDTLALTLITVHVIRKNGRFITPNSDLGIVPGVKSTQAEVNDVIDKIRSTGKYPTDFTDKDMEVTKKVMDLYPKSKNEYLVGKRYFGEKGRIPTSIKDNVIKGIGTFMVDARLIDTYETKKDHWDEILQKHYSEINSEKAAYEKKIADGLKEKDKIIKKIKEWCADDYIGQKDSKVRFKFSKVTSVRIVKTESTISKDASQTLKKLSPDQLFSLAKAAGLIDVEKLTSDLKHEESVSEGLINEISEVDKENDSKPLFSDRLRRKLEALDLDEKQKKDSVTKAFILRITGITSDDKPVALYATYSADEAKNGFISKLFTKFPSFGALDSYKAKKTIPSDAYEVSTSKEIDATIISANKIVRFNSHDAQHKEETFGGETSGKKPSRKGEMTVVDLEYEPIESILKATKDSQTYHGITYATVNYTRDGDTKETEESTDNAFLQSVLAIYRHGIMELKRKGEYVGDKNEEVRIEIAGLRYATKSKDKEGNTTYFMMGRTKTGDWFVYNMPVEKGPILFSNFPKTSEGIKALPDKLNTKIMGLKTTPINFKVAGYSMKEKGDSNLKLFKPIEYAKENGIDALKEAMSSSYEKMDGKKKYTYSVSSEFTGVTKLS